jgi:hypothetical protein
VAQNPLPQSQSPSALPSQAVLEPALQQQARPSNIKPPAIPCALGMSPGSPLSPWSPRDPRHEKELKHHRKQVVSLAAEIHVYKQRLAKLRYQHEEETFAALERRFNPPTEEKKAADEEVEDETAEAKEDLAQGRSSPPSLLTRSKSRRSAGDEAAHALAQQYKAQREKEKRFAMDFATLQDSTDNVHDF